MTLEEINEEGWKHYEKQMKKKVFPAQKDYVGKRVKSEFDRMISIYDFCSHAGCNVFHQKDIGEALIQENTPYTINYWSVEGRDRYCEITVHGRKDHYIKAHASGYGCGDYFIFSKKFPKKLKFRLMRRLSLDNVSDMVSYCMDGGYDLLSVKTTYELLWNHIRTLDDLYEYTAIIALKSSLETTREIEKTWKKDSSSFMKNYKPDGKRLRAEWKNTIKTPRYKTFLKVQAKVRKELKSQENQTKKKPVKIVLRIEKMGRYIEEKITKKQICALFDLQYMMDETWSTLKLNKIDKDISKFFGIIDHIDEAMHGGAPIPLNGHSVEKSKGKFYLCGKPNWKRIAK